MKNFLRIVTPLALLTFLMACSSPKSVILFQQNGQSNTITSPATYESTINVGDVLAIQVSSLNPQASTLFNPLPSVAGTESSTSAAPATGTGYRVNQQGEITMPVIGKLMVKGLTNARAELLIQERLKEQLKEPTVSVRNLNFRISVLGEVNRPALYTIQNEQITLPEALGLAGDLTIYGRRTNVLVVREENGQKVFAHVDLTQRDLFQSPYYYLHSNDIVYVEPGRGRQISADRFYLISPLLVSLLTSLVFVFSRTF